MDGSMKDLHHKLKKKRSYKKGNLSVPVLHVFIEVKPFLFMEHSSYELLLSRLVFLFGIMVLRE